MQTPTTASTASLINQVEDPAVRHTLDLIDKGSTLKFNEFIGTIPKPQRLDFFLKCLDKAKEVSIFLRMRLMRRAAQHPDYREFVIASPTYFTQRIPFVQIPQLSTRACISYLEHPLIALDSIDYTVSLVNQNGKTIWREDRTLLKNETHTFDVSTIFKQSSENSLAGMFFFETVEQTLHSLRVYAQYFNENCLTTTHEKGLLVNRNELITYPYFIENGELETWLLIGNFQDFPLKLSGQLRNHEGTLHHSILNMQIEGKSTAFLRLAKIIPDLTFFLHDRLGAFSIKNSGVGGIYYYFTRNKRLDTWQIQHL